MIIYLIFLKDQNDASQRSQSNAFIQTPTILDIDSDEEYDYVPRSASFLTFSRPQPPPPPPSSSSFLLFGRSHPTFLRFGRGAPQSASSNFLRFGRKVEFLKI